VESNLQQLATTENGMTRGILTGVSYQKQHKRRYFVLAVKLLAIKEKGN
jgi:hypothetical protein